MILRNIAGKTLAMLAAAFVACACFASTVTIKSSDARLQVSICDKDAWAICRLQWKDASGHLFDFIDAYDHGRELQSASSFDNLGESFNPTQAGSAADGVNNRTSSVIQSLSVTTPVIDAQVRMAFWQPVNGQVTSNHVHRQVVTLNWGGNPHIMAHDVSFTLPADEDHSLAQFETLTGYMPPAFSHFRTYDPSTATLSELDDGPGEQPYPIVFCDTSDAHCMGIYSNAPLQMGGYGRWRFIGSACMTNKGASGCVKWNAVERVNNPTPGATYSFRRYTIVGTLSDVKAGMDWLYANP